MNIRAFGRLLFSGFALPKLAFRESYFLPEPKPKTLFEALRSKRFVRRMAVAMVLVLGSTFAALQANADPTLRGENSTIDRYMELNQGSTTNQSLLHPNPNFLNGNYDATWEAWVYPTSTSGYDPIFSKEGNFVLGLEDGKIWYALSDGNLWIQNRTPFTVPTNTWSHIAYIKIGTGMVIFLNGQEAAYFPNGAYTYTRGNTGDSLYIGGRPGIAGQYFSGRIDEVRMWGTDRRGFIASDMHSKISGSTSGLQGYWDFNEPSGNVVYNRKADAGDLTTQNSPIRGDVKTLSATSTGDTVITFNRTYLPSSGNWTVPANASNVKALVVAGGGGGGVIDGGGGGAGGMIEFTSLNLSGEVKITVGQGGPGGQNATNDWRHGRTGQDSYLGSVRALGGGGGGGYGYPSDTYWATGWSGGSGGGHAEFNGTIEPAAGTQATDGVTYSNATEYGNAGGRMTYFPSQAGSGGGGAGSAGGAVTAFQVGGAGGSGKDSSITGISVFYAAGGGGADRSGNGASGGSSIGGNGGGVSIAATYGKENTGSGGGGASGVSPQAGGLGGSGVIIVRYTPPNLDMAWDDTVSDEGVLNRTDHVIPNSSSADFTFEAWILPAAVRSNQYEAIFQQRSTDSTNYSQRYGLWLRDDGNGQLFFFVDLGSAQFNQSIPNIRGQWNHVAMAVTGGTTHLYLNGAYLGANSVSRVSTPGGLFSLSGNPFYSQGFKGQIDNVKIWNSKLESNEINESMHTYAKGSLTASKTLLAHYDFNEYTEGAVVDRSGNGKTLVPSSTLTWNTESLKTTAIFETGTAHSTLQNVVKFNRTYLTAAGGWTPPAGYSRAKLLVVGGGGGGGGRHAGGGGAGGFIETEVTLTQQVQRITVGPGGLGSPYLATNTSINSITARTQKGGDSSAFGLTAIGGGAGGGKATDSGSLSGGSGGGTDANASYSPLGSRQAGQGNLGGQGAGGSGESYGGGGGGGAGAAGSAVTSGRGGAGGVGLASSITGTRTFMDQQAESDESDL